MCTGRKNSKSTMINIRVPNFILNDLHNLCNLLGYSSLSNFIVNIMSAEILKFNKVLYYEN